jgi:hypothetical protein
MKKKGYSIAACKDEDLGGEQKKIKRAGEIDYRQQGKEKQNQRLRDWVGQ